LHQIARDQGMLTLYEDGLRHVLDGLTTLDEILRVTQD
jgi:general secretion pathway protein E